MSKNINLFITQEGRERYGNKAVAGATALSQHSRLAGATVTFFHS